MSPVMCERDEEHRSGRVDERALQRVLTRPFRIRRGGTAIARRPPKRAPSARKTSGRVGWVHGWPTRTTTIKVEPARRGGALARYTHRLHAASDRDAEDLVVSSTDAAGIAEFERAIAGVEAGIAAAGEAIPKDRRAAAYGIVIDLPYDGDTEYRAEVMRAIAGWFESRGHRAEWAVHSGSARNGDYPHGHLVVAAGADGRRPIDGGDVMKRFRRHVADTVNRTYVERFGRRLPIEFHGGTLRDTGITRPPRPDIPRGLWHAREAARDYTAADRSAPQRTVALAAAADRIEAAWARDVAAGRQPEPQGLARRRWRIRQREDWHEAEMRRAAMLKDAQAVLDEAALTLARQSAREADLRQRLADQELKLSTERETHNHHLAWARRQGEMDGQRSFAQSYIVPYLPSDLASRYLEALPDGEKAGRQMANRLIEGWNAERRVEWLERENRAMTAALSAAREATARKGTGLAARVGRAIGLFGNMKASEDNGTEPAAPENSDLNVWLSLESDIIPPTEEKARSSPPASSGSEWEKHDAEYKHPGVLFPLPPRSPAPPSPVIEPEPRPTAASPAPPVTHQFDPGGPWSYGAGGPGVPQPAPPPGDRPPPLGDSSVPSRRRPRGHGMG